MASLSLREGVQEHLLIEGSILQGQSARYANTQSCLNRESGYTIKYAFNSHETFWLNGKKIHLAPGESLFINQRYSRAHQYEASALSRGLCLHYQESELMDLYRVLKNRKIIDYSFQSFQEIPELRFERQTHLNSKLKEICRDIEEDQFSIKQAGFESILEEMLLEIDWELIGYNQRLQEFNPATRQSLIRKVVQARKFMLANLHRPLKLEDIASEVAMSPFHFQRQYKKATGKSPNRHLVEWRIENAKELLREGKNSVLEISTMLAYNDLPTFSKAFKREVGSSPSNWQKQFVKNS
jgi:AraC-like DNA-binding protein